MKKHVGLCSLHKTSYFYWPSWCSQPMFKTSKVKFVLLLWLQKPYHLKTCFHQQKIHILICGEANAVILTTPHKTQEVNTLVLEVTICRRLEFKSGQHKSRYLYDVQHFQHHTVLQKESAIIWENVTLLNLHHYKQKYLYKMYVPFHKKHQVLKLGSSNFQNFI